MGVDTSPSPMTAAFGSPTPPRQFTPRPSTPTVVPSPVPGPSSARLPTSSNDVFDAQDTPERQANRRSMYRSPGTSSSPDLATLLRKAKERGGPVGPHLKKDKRRDSPPPPVPPPHDRPSTSGRPRSSTSYSSNPQGTKGKLSKPSKGEAWVPPSPRQTKENGSTKGKSSVRAKTTAFLGKMLGQGTSTVRTTVRERSKTDASAPAPATYTTPSLFDAFTPPLPPLPVEHQRTPVGSPVSDAFTSSQRVANNSKPLPPITINPVLRQSDDSDERSLIFVDRMVAEDGAATSLDYSNTIKASKRRSRSVGEAELKKAMASASSHSPLRSTFDRMNETPPPHLDYPALNGILDDFKGELSQLDPVSGSSLVLRDPSAPSHRAPFQSKTDDSVLLTNNQEEYPNNSPRTHASPTLTLQIPSHQIDDLDDRTSVPSSPIVPPRRSSLQRSTSRPHSIASPRGITSRHASSPLRSRSGPALGPSSPTPRDNTRLRTLHRSTASSSEPSLIPTGDDGRIFPPSDSQHDIINDLTLRRLSSSIHSSGAASPLIGDETTDMVARGKDLALRCWNEDEEFLAKDKIAEWLGGNSRINKLALHHYVNFFEFSGLRLDLAFRRLCAKLFLRGETQQVDRILEEFSRRYWECNPGGVYGSANIVHAVSYSLLLLNTDLHVADLTTRMSRNQFVRNTLTAIQMQMQPTPPAQISTSDLTYDDCGSSIRGSDGTETVSRSHRSNSITSRTSMSRECSAPLPIETIHVVREPNGSTPSVQISTYEHKLTSNPVYGRAWESDMEVLLKEMYNAIKSQQILQPLNSSARSFSSSLGPGATMMRSRSTRGPPDRLTTLKRGSIRGLQSILSNQPNASPYSSNSSIDGRVSPSPSFATSTHEVHYNSSSSFLTPTLGFASNLSHTIIREAHEDDDRSIHSNASNSTTISITDEELALLGAPWAKEGMLHRKQYWESTGRRARDKAWLDVFVVIQRGELNMFTFGERSNGGSGGTFGGGNWLANAHAVGTVHLAHSLAHALPPPGYNRQRPYCMVLTMANGAVYFFQAGTEELVNEWVSTCNYWAARTSKEPLTGGVSNMEYGWNRVADAYPYGPSQPETESIKDSMDYSDAMSVRSTRSIRSKFSWREGAATVRASQSPWIDRTSISDWKPPLPPTVSSVHDEETQLEALKKHVASMKKDLEQHNEYRQPMAALYQPRSSNAVKSQSNWEKKSQYLLTEIVKYDSYIESLQGAMALRLKKRGEKALERALNGTTPSEDLSLGVKGKWKGPEEETIREEAEPTTPGPGQFKTRSHRRETAETEP